MEPLPRVPIQIALPAEVLNEIDTTPYDDVETLREKIEALLCAIVRPADSARATIVLHWDPREWDLYHWQFVIAAIGGPAPLISRAATVKFGGVKLSGEELRAIEEARPGKAIELIPEHRTFGDVKGAQGAYDEAIKKWRECQQAIEELVLLATGLSPGHKDSVAIRHAIDLATESPKPCRTPGTCGKGTPHAGRCAYPPPPKEETDG